MRSITANTIFYGDNLEILKQILDSSIQLIFIDPPFNTGRAQTRLQLKTKRSENGDRVGFKGERYETTVIGQKSFNDSFDDFVGFIKPRLIEAHRVLSNTGSLYFHIDYREVHYCKALLDKIFGYDNLYRGFAEVEIATLGTLIDIGVISESEGMRLRRETRINLLLDIPTTPVDKIE